MPISPAMVVVDQINRLMDADCLDPLGLLERSTVVVDEAYDTLAGLS